MRRPTAAERRKPKRIREDSVFWQPGRMGNRRGQSFPDLLKNLRSKGA